jgi:hypothetical protein
MKRKRQAYTDTSAPQGAAYPSQWKDFIAATKGREFSNAAAASRFSARYRIATGFRSASFDGIAKETAGGFSVLLKVMLAANAMEAMITLRGLKLHAVEIIDECLASDLRKQAPILLDLLLECADKTHRPRLRAVKECESNDLWIIARAVRNTLAHGVLTSNGAGVTRSKRQRDLQERLAAAVLRAADDQFSQWFAAMGASSAPP